MAEICEILQGIPDDAARLRVMRWSFARFGGEEFKRAVPNLAPQLPKADTLPQPVSSQYEPEAVQEMPAIEDVQGSVDVEDIAHQVSELNDLFPRRPVAGRRPDGVSKLRQV